MVDKDVYLLANNTLKDTINGMFVKSVIEVVEYLENYNINFLKLLQSPIYGYVVTDNNGKEISLFRMDYSFTNTHEPIKIVEDKLVLSISMYNGKVTHQEIAFSIYDLTESNLNIIPLKRSDYFNKTEEMEKSLFNL